jgi:hypothetical protein
MQYNVYTCLDKRLNSTPHPGMHESFGTLIEEQQQLSACKVIIEHHFWAI